MVFIAKSFLNLLGFDETLQQHMCQKGNWLLKEINPFYCEIKREVKKKNLYKKL